MITNGDEKRVRGIVREEIKEAFSDFWFNVLEPYLAKKLEENERVHERFERKLDLSTKGLNNHEERIQDLESVVKM